MSMFTFEHFNVFTLYVPVKESKWSITVCNQPYHCRNSHATQHSCLYPSQLRLVPNLATLGDAGLS